VSYYVVRRSPLSIFFKVVVGFPARVLVWVLGRLGVAALAGTRLGFRGAKVGVTGQWRHIVHPVLVALVLWIPFDGSAGTWLTFGVVIALVWKWRSRRSGDRRHLSDRETLLLASALLAAGTWHLLWRYTAPHVAVAPNLRWVLAGIYGAGAVVGVWQWATGRRPRREPVDEFLNRWAHEVAYVEGWTPVDEHGQLTVHLDEATRCLGGKWISWESTTPGSGTGVLELAWVKASDAAKLDEDVERVLDARRGSVTLSTDPKLTVRQLRVTIAADPDVQASRLNHWQGPTLDADTRFVMSSTPDGRPKYGMLRDTKEGSALHAAFIAPPGSGKGGAVRIAVTEAAHDAHTHVIAIDGKRGAGVPYLKGATHTYVSDPDLWLPALEGFVAAMNVRSDRHAEEGRDSFAPRPGEPQMILLIDELPKVVAAGGARARQLLLELTGTGRSLGYSLWATMQKGDDPSWGGTTVRSNVMDNGWVWLGPATDQQAKSTSYQSLATTYGIDPTALPAKGGWGYVVGRALTGQSGEAARGLWLPNRLDVTERGKEAPFGICEDILEASAVFPDWDEDEETAFTRALAGETPQAPAASTPARGGALSVPDVMAAHGPTEDAPVIVERPLRVASGRDRVLAVIRDADEGVSLRQVAGALDLHPSTVHEHAQRLQSEGLVYLTDAGWRAAS